jgi:hypothetical protein
VATAIQRRRKSLAEIVARSRVASAPRMTFAAFATATAAAEDGCPSVTAVRNTGYPGARK